MNRLRILTVIIKFVDSKKENATYDHKAQNQLAREAAAKSMVLLKNDNDVLPLAPKGKITVIGSFAMKPRYQGAGSLGAAAVGVPYYSMFVTLAEIRAFSKPSDKQ